MIKPPAINPSPCMQKVRQQMQLCSGDLITQWIARNDSQALPMHLEVVVFDGLSRPSHIFPCLPAHPIEVTVMRQPEHVLESSFQHTGQMKQHKMRLRTRAGWPMLSMTGCEPRHC